MTTSQDTASWKALLSGQNGIKSIVLAGGTALHATNIYLSTTILPSVIEEIGGLSFYAWNTTLFMVASIIGSVLSRKILSKNGARASFRIAFLIFGLGTLICGLAPSMLVMLIGRTIQGFGGGIIFALAYAMIRLIFEERFWPKAFSLVSGMWGIATLLGPLLGGIFAEMNAWRYAFFCLLPLLFIFIFIGERTLPTKNNSEETTVILTPWLKIGMITSAVLAIAISSLSQDIAYNAFGLVISLSLFGLLYFLEKKTTNRLMPTGAYSLKNAAGFYYGIISLLVISSSLEVFIPYFLQTIQLINPFKAGFIAAFMAVGWTLGSLGFSSVSKEKIKTLLFISGILMTVSFIGLALLFPNPAAGSGKLFYLLCLLIICIGIGIGMVWPHLLTMVLSNAKTGEEELATTSITTTQLVMTSLGSAFCGLIVNFFGISNPGGIIGATSAAQGLFGLAIILPVLILCIVLVFFKKNYIQSYN